MGPVTPGSPQSDKAPLNLPQLAPQGDATTILAVAPNIQQMNSGEPPATPLRVDVAIKCSVDVFYFSVPYDLSFVLVEPAPQAISKETFGSRWSSASDAQKMATRGTLQSQVSPDQLKQRLRTYYTLFVAQQEDERVAYMYFASCTCNNIYICCEIGLQRNAPGVQL